jgi:predicted acylesterase/phospholipase RssA
MRSSLNGVQPQTMAAVKRPPASRIAVVLPGGGARGAYEVGALEVLLAALEQRGE